MIETVRSFQKEFIFVSGMDIGRRNILFEIGLLRRFLVVSLTTLIEGWWGKS